MAPKTTQPPWSLYGEPLREALAGALDEARSRTLGLVEGLSDEVMGRQHSPLMSPLAWDLGHIANYEERWLLGAVEGGRLSSQVLDETYDATLHPRASRGELPKLTGTEARAYLARVRAQVLAHLARAGTFKEDPLRHAGFVWGMVASHEHQHCETLCATLQLMEAPPWRPPEAPEAPVPSAAAAVEPGAEVFVPAGPFVMGTDDEAWAYDNERPAHVVDVPAFFIDRHPVTCGQFRAFIEDGGYRRRELWSPEGFAHAQREGIDAPLFWRREGRGFVRRRFDAIEEVPAHEPVQHVCWYEADAFARWAGKRLPTEAEWEKAASSSPEGKRRYPWGDDPVTPARANLCSGLWRPSPVGSLPEGTSAVGCAQLLGEVWEWTASDFAPYPGFRAFPYRAYSEAFFGGGYKVLRGGSWATHPLVARTTFRNWDFPIRRQIFAGFRCAREADLGAGSEGAR